MEDNKTQTTIAYRDEINRMFSNEDAQLAFIDILKRLIDELEQRPRYCNFGGEFKIEIKKDAPVDTGE